MDRLKTLAMYVSWVVLFFIFSNILIFIGLNGMYKEMGTSSDVPEQVQINQADATSVNGRIRGTITNNGEEDINGKYMKVDLYSPRNVLLGTKYLQIGDLAKGAQDEFDLNFKAKDVSRYNISFVDQLEGINNSNETYKFNGIKGLRESLDKVTFLDRPLTTHELIILLITLMLLG